MAEPKNIFEEPRGSAEPWLKNTALEAANVIVLGQRKTDITLLHCTLLVIKKFWDIYS